VKVYAGEDPLSKRRHYLTEVVPAGPKTAQEAEKIRTRLLSQVDDRRNPRTRATVDQLLDRWLDVVELESTTREGYEGKLNKHVRPFLASCRSVGSTPRRRNRSTRACVGAAPSAVIVAMAANRAFGGTASFNSSAALRCTASYIPSAAIRFRAATSSA
jgi:hypothetical protein